MDQEEECLLCHHKFVAKSENARHKQQKPDWKASTLLLSYTSNRGLRENSTLNTMVNQLVDRLTIENLITTTNTQSLAKGYILNCKYEGKSEKTIAIYEMVLKNFIWYCKQNNFPEVHQLTPIHLRHFLYPHPVDLETNLD
jgi:hypothetical protein